MRFLEFIKATKKYYGKEVGISNVVDSTVICFMVSNDIYASAITMKLARAVADVSRSKLCVFPNVSSSKKHHRLLDSYCPNSIVGVRLEMISALLGNAGKLLRCFCTLNTGAKIHRYCDKEGSAIGMHLYDYLLRKLFLDTINDVSLRMRFLIVVELAYYFSAIKTIEKLKPIWVILPDNTYRQGMIFEYAKSNVIPTLAGLDLNDFAIHKYCKPQDFHSHCRSPSKALCDTIVGSESNMSLAREYFRGRASGLGRQHDVTRAFSQNKRKLSKRQMIEKYELNPELPIVLVAAHVFCDAPHAYPGALFQDYYHWYLETCKCLLGNESVNFIVKEHPSSELYNERGTVRKISQEAGLEIKILSDDIQTASLFDVVDCLVTCGGTAGMEFAACGVPVVVASSPPYSHLPFVLSSRNREVYFSRLEKAHHLERLSKSACDFALAALYAIHGVQLFEKEFLGLGIEKIYLGQELESEKFMSQVASDYDAGAGYELLKSTMSSLLLGEENNVINYRMLN